MSEELLSHQAVNSLADLKLEKGISGSGVVVIGLLVSGLVRGDQLRFSQASTTSLEQVARLSTSMAFTCSSAVMGPVSGLHSAVI